MPPFNLKFQARYKNPLLYDAPDYAKDFPFILRRFYVAYVDNFIITKD